MAIFVRLDEGFHHLGLNEVAVESVELVKPRVVTREVRHPDFAKKVRFIEVEFASTTEQATLNRYIRGENVSPARLAQIWKTTTQANNGIWDDPMYAPLCTWAPTLTRKRRKTAKEHFAN